MRSMFRCMMIGVITLCLSSKSFSQQTNWSPDGNSTLAFQDGDLVKTDVATGKEEVLFKPKELTPEGATKPIRLESFQPTKDGKKLLLFANSARVWRRNTRGDYWYFDLTTKKLIQLGKDRPSQTLMFAKFSPDEKSVAYVSERNIYTEDIATGKVTQLTTDGKNKLINGTFDWVYEEEFDCRDGFRWSPDGKTIAYWQVDANQIRDYLMLNTTDSVYSHVVPVEYPKVGEPPSPVKIGVVAATGGATKWMDIPGDPRNNYLPRLTWAANSTEILVEQMSRKQNEAKLYLCDVSSGAATNIYTENDNAWVDVNVEWANETPENQVWINKGKEFVWVSEKDGWRHIYRISRDGKKEVLITNGKYDIGAVSYVDEKNNAVYFTASPENATQKYLYKTKLDGKGKLELVTPSELKGVNYYDISPNGKFAFHYFSSHTVPPVREWLLLPSNKPIKANESILKTMKPVASNVDFIQITTDDNVTVDAWVAKPENFDSTKKYPMVLYVYGEPASTTVMDSWGIGKNGLYNGDMAKDGYFYVSVDNRGTPSLKGAAWRKAIYKNIGTLNIRDQALAVQKFISTRPYIDTSRIGVHGWSGGGSSTLNLLFQFPETFKTGIAVAAVANQLFYDNIYQERYMGLPQENLEDFQRGSPVNHAADLRGHLLYIHGTGDDNVHYDNAEVLINALVKNNKIFQLMSYPNRSHGIFEGEGTRGHLINTFTQFLRTYCPPGAVSGGGEASAPPKAF